MPKRWITANAQREMRENVRSAIKAAGMTQSQAAHAAGLPYNRLVQWLAGKSWFSEEDIASLAEVLDVEVCDLVGGSIFKGDAREAEFDYLPSGEPAPTKRQGGRMSRALCCECGALRLVDRGDLGHCHTYDGTESSGRRMIGMHLCGECGIMTNHALLRDRRGDEGRDWAETLDHTPTRSQEARSELDQLIERVRSFGVEVEWASSLRGRFDRKDETYLVGYEHVNGHWRIELLESGPSEVLLRRLKVVWKRIASDDHEVDWDAKEGVYFLARRAELDRDIDNLIEDIQRFGSVERRRMAMEIRDEAIREEFRVSGAGETDG